MQTTTDGEDARTSRIFLRPIGSPLPLGMAALASHVAREAGVREQL